VCLKGLSLEVPRTSAIALDIKASFLIAGCLCGADTGRIGTTTGSWVWILGGGDSDGRNSGNDDKELHVRGCWM
jgi:hypothetical protein